MAIFKENVKRCGFAMVSSVLIRGYRDLSDGAFRTYCNLLIYAWQGNVAYPSVKQQAEDLKITEREVQRRLGELEKVRLIFREYRISQPSILWVQDPSDEEVKIYQEKYCKILDNSGISYPQDKCSGVTKRSPGGDQTVTSGVTKMSPKIEDSFKKKGEGFQPVENPRSNDTQLSAISMELFKEAKKCFEKSLGDCGASRYKTKKNKVCDACPAFKKSEDARSS